MRLDLIFIDDALSDQLDRHLAFDEPSNESLQELSCLSCEVLVRVWLCAIEATSWVYEDCIFVFTRHEAIAYFRVGQETIAIFIEFVEDYKYLVFCNRQLQIVDESWEEVIAINPSLSRLQLCKHFIDVAHVKIRAQSQLSSLLLEQPFDFSHVTDSLGKISSSIEKSIDTSLLWCWRVKRILPISKVMLHVDWDLI